MSRFIPIETPAGPIWAEVDDSLNVDSLKMTGVKDITPGDLEHLVEAVNKNARWLLQEMNELAPDEIKLAFGIKVGAEAGLPLFALAKTSGEASIEVTMKWGKENDVNNQIKHSMTR